MSPIAALLLIAAQDHRMHDMPGMTMPMPSASARPKRAAKPPPKQAATPKRRAIPRAAPASRTAPTPPAMDHSAMDHMSMDTAPMDHAGMDHAGMGHAGLDHGGALGTDLPPGDAPAPAAPLPHMADLYWDPAAMARGRAIMMGRDGGGRRFAQVMVNIAEYAVRNGRDGYRWDGEAWLGGDIDRLVVKSEGEGDVRGTLGGAEVRALYSRAVGPYFNLQGGVRQDIRPTPARTYATLGIAGLAPYWFEVEAAAFLSTHGEVLARVEGYYDQRLTQRLILQPRAEFNLSAQRARAIGIGSGVTSADLGLRLRYEVKREFAPYVALTWERRLGETARFARAAGQDAGGPALAFGIRGWF